MELRVRLLPTTPRLLAIHQQELPQKDELCGPFCTLLALRALTAEGAMSLDQDEVALAAGTTVASAAEADSSLPPGHPGRRDYRAQLPVADDPKLSGTNAGGLIRAVERLTQGSAAAVPLTARWEGERIADLLELGERHSAAVLLNLQTGRLWGSRPDPAGVLAFLRGEPANAPAADWAVGHFVALVGSVHGPARELAVVADTYETLGWRGVHLQPFDALAAALNRDAPRTGGALMVVGGEAVEPLAEDAEGRGFEIIAWDNGSVDVAAG